MSNTVDDIETSKSRKEKRKALMHLSLDQQPSGKKKKYNLWLNDVLTPLIKEDCTLHTPDLNKFTINTPEEEFILKGFKLPSTPTAVSQAILLSPLLLSPNLNSPSVTKWLDSCNETKPSSELPDLSLNNNLISNLDNLTLQPDHHPVLKIEEYDQSTLIVNEGIQATDEDQKAKFETIQIDNSKSIEIIEPKTDENLPANQDNSNQMMTVNNQQMNGTETIVMNKIETVNQPVTQMYENSTLYFNELNTLPINEFFKPTDDQSFSSNSTTDPINHLVNHTMDSNVHQINLQPTSTYSNTNNFPVSSTRIHPNNFVNGHTNLYPQKTNPAFISHIVQSNNQYHPIQSNYPVNHSTCTFNNQVNYYYNNQHFASYNRPASDQITDGNYVKNSEKSHKSTDSLNSFDSQSSNERKSEHELSNKIEDKKAKNRAAASRCRQRKQERVNRLEEQVRKLNAENIKLIQSQNQLIQVNNQLRHQIFLHTKNGCTLVNYDNAVKVQDTNCSGMTCVYSFPENSSV